MARTTRRTLLKLLGATAAVGSTGVAGAKPDWAGPPKKGRIRKLGHSLLSDPSGGYAEEDVREDGKYALVGHFGTAGGSFLVDISNPTDPTQVHEFRPRPMSVTRTSSSTGETGSTTEDEKVAIRPVSTSSTTATTKELPKTRSK
jgi:hypothetical protein